MAYCELLIEVSPSTPLLATNVVYKVYVRVCDVRRHNQLDVNVDSSRSDEPVTVVRTPVSGRGTLKQSARPKNLFCCL